MVKILFVFTGGTIGSTVSDRYIVPDPSKSYRILEAYRERYESDFVAETVQPYTILSENSNGRTIRELVSCIRQRIGEGFDGVIVLHGSDTLQYTAAALGYCFGNDCIPICVVASNRPIEDPEANGLSNLKCAVELIRRSFGKGVFVPYGNPSEPFVTVHRATRLLSSPSFSDRFSSMKDLFRAVYDETNGFSMNPDYRECMDETKPLEAEGLTESCHGIMRISACPGMVFPKIDEEVRYLIMESFHSGTINTDCEEYREFFREMDRRKIRVYVTGIPDGIPYESTKQFEELKISPVSGIAPIAFYMKLWLASSAGSDVERILRRSLGGDIQNSVCSVTNS